MIKNTFFKQGIGITKKAKKQEGIAGVDVNHKFCFDWIKMFTNHWV